VWARQGRPESQVFFRYDTSEVSRLLQELRAIHSWPADLKFDGPHVFRHSMAEDIYDTAIKGVQDRGGWSAFASGERYAALAVSGRLAAGAAKKAQEEAKRRQARRH
jgi:hypothetical protein